MANVYDKLKEMNLTLPTPPAKGGLYTRLWEAQAQYYRETVVIPGEISS